MAVNLSAVDLNLFHVLHAVLEERSATRAAARLHVTQSAVSNALARLRQVLGDPLVERRGRGLAPTPLARELAPRLASAVASLEEALQRAERFDPRETTRLFTLAMADHWQLSELPPILAALASEAPRARLQVVGIEQLHATDGLRAGTVDAALRPVQASGPGLRSAPLFSEQVVIVVRRGHPAVDRPRELLQGPMVDVQISGPGSATRQLMIDRARAAGFELSSLVVVPTFPAAAMAVLRTDACAVIPRRLAETIAAGWPLALVELPFPAPPLEIVLQWHERAERDAGARFFREVVLARYPRRRSRAIRKRSRSRAS